MANRSVGPANRQPLKLNGRVLAVVMATLTILGVLVWMLLWQ